MLRMRGAPVSRAVAEQRAHLAREVVEVLLFLGLIILIVHVFIQAKRISTTLMEPQLQPEQIVVVNTKAYALGAPSRGDVVLVANPQNPSDEELLRVIAVPGDTVTLTATQTIVDNVVLNEPYVQVAPGQAENNTLLPPTKLGPGQYYVMGDNRPTSGTLDSRGFGAVPRQNIEGKAMFITWPVSQFHLIPTFPDVFANVHGS